MHTPLPWRAGYEDGSGPTTVMTVASHQKFSKVGIRVESGETKRGKFVTLTRDETVKPLNFGHLPDIICGMVGEDLAEDEQIANAEFIVLACNSYDGLVAALKAVVEDDGTRLRPSVLCKVRDAIAKVGQR